MVQEIGIENLSFQQQAQMKKEIEIIAKELDQNNMKKKIQDENNRYEQEYRLGNKLTYGQPIQLKHLFSDRYLSIKMNDVSTEPGSSVLYLGESTDNAWFTLEPINSLNSSAGLVINYNDYFFIKSSNSKTPFYMHVMTPEGELKRQQSYQLNASQESSVMKAKLFMGYDQRQMDKTFIQSGDCIRLKQVEKDIYLTSQTKVVDVLLPEQPDFLKGQIRRMMLGTSKIERSKGGLDAQDVVKEELTYKKNDVGFELAVICDDYINKLKGNAHEKVYLEGNNNVLKFTNSCWEIQRTSPLSGGNIVIDELVRIKHIGTSKYLSLGLKDPADTEESFFLQTDPNNLQTLFFIRSKNMNGKGASFVDLDGDGVIDNPSHISSGAHIMIQSFLREGYVQMFDEDLEQEADETCSQHEGEDMNSHPVKLIGGEFQKKKKTLMLFCIEEISKKEAIQSYNGSWVFDELLEFYTFLNVWAVNLVAKEEKSEKFYYKNDQAMEHQDKLKDKCDKVMFILNNVETQLKVVEFLPDELAKCKQEMAEQGFLDIIFRCLEMMYYKMTPPSMFSKPFRSVKEFRKLMEQKESKKDVYGLVDAVNIRIDEYVAHEIARETLNPVLMKMLEMILIMIRAHRANSEKAVKYQGILYQHYIINEHYFIMKHQNKYFKSPTCPRIEYLQLINEIVSRIMKNSQLLHSEEQNKLIDQNFPSIERTIYFHTVNNWLGLLEPVKYLARYD